MNSILALIMIESLYPYTIARNRKTTSLQTCILRLLLGICYLFAHKNHLFFAFFVKKYTGWHLVPKSTDIHEISHQKR